jgi:MFS family permease
MIGMLVLAAQLSTNIFVPRFGPKIMVPTGMVLAMIGMILLTRLDLDSSYAANVLPALMVMGFGMGTIMPASMQTATLGVDREFACVASAMVNTSQQVGGSIGVALLNSGKRRQAMQRFRQAASRRASAATWAAYFDPQAQ